MPSNQNMNDAAARAGLNTDNIIDQVQKGYVTDALNAINGSFDGQAVTYQNEEGNVHCITMPSGYKCIGVKNVMQISQVWYFITNPSTGYSIIGYVADNTCVFVSVIDDSVFGSDLLNFNIKYPIHKIEIKTTNCSTQLYWTDRYNHRRYIDLNNLPWKTGTTNVLDINKMDVQPVFKIPTISFNEITVGGNLLEGCYQFAVQYSDIKSEGMTSWYSVTNPVRVFLESKVSASYNLQTNYAISLNINNLDRTGLYQYFNLAVIKTINAVTTVELVGTYFIQSDTYRHVYTGDEQSAVNIQLTLADIMQQTDYYDIAGDLTQVDNSIVWADLIEEEDISYQKIFNQVKVYWGTSQVPVGQTIGYHNGVECAQVEGYFRDEVYALEGCFLFNNGKQSDRFHIPGRVAQAYDLEVVDNLDSNAVVSGTCPTPFVPRWKVYNTGNVIGFLAGATDPCTGIRPWNYGQMSYWESEEVYPANEAIWGSLANQPIRHHKFPDCIISPIHDGAVSPSPSNSFNPGYVYPIGFKIDIESLYSAIISSADLTDAQKRSIVGFKIMRSDRAGERSIIAKGMFYNVGQYAKDGSTYFYPNYPFNDVNPDPFISLTPVPSTPVTFTTKMSGTVSTGTPLNAFQKDRFTFHSPDTHFYQPSGIQDSLVYLETIETGITKSHFVKVKNNAGEKIRCVNALEIALIAGFVSTVGIDIDTSQSVTDGVTTTSFDIRPTFNAQNFFPTFNNMLDILDKLSPYYNYGWQYNGVGYYSQSVPVPDTGNKVRFIKYGGYINSGLQGTFGDVHPINNTDRESSVYVSLTNTLPYTHEQVPGVPVDTSRKIASQVNRQQSSTPFYEPISAYYGSLKAIRPGQYGQVFSYRAIDTDTNQRFMDDQNGLINDMPIVYGGDCFINLFALKIKHPFYLKSTVDRPDGFDIDYNQDPDPTNTSQAYTNTGNVGYPIWYYSTTNLPFVEDALLQNGLTNINGSLDFINSSFNAIQPLSSASAPVAALDIIIGLSATIISVPILVFEILEVFLGLLTSNLFTTLGLKVTNLDYYQHNDIYEKGMAYLYAYGIPYFFCESQVNVDMRQAYNDREGDFYPHVATDIPDDWLQETNVHIAFDNTYTYNKTYSKQNHETAFATIRPDWQPGQQCYITYNNRAIWSEASDMEDTRNNWLVYKPANTFDFPKSFGPLVAIDRLESRAVMVRYVNHTQLYNAQATIETTAINAALGTGTLFSGTQPIDFNISDSGYAGTQHKFLLQTEHGHIFVDAMRGQVILVRGTSVEELSSSKYLNSKWFQNNLPFNIIKSFSTYPIDNNFNGCGLHGVYDDYYKRLIITKIDYLPNEGVQYDGTEFYVINQKNKTIIQLGDPEYFCNKSWTMSFSFLSNSWISWHSYLPNFYVQDNVSFQSGMNTNTCMVWNHNQAFDLFNNFYGIDYPYIIEYPFTYQYLDQLLQYVEEYMTVLKYESRDIYIEPDETIYFTQCIVYNKQASTGLLNLVPKDINNRAQYFSYPIYNTDSIDILVTKVDHMYSYNMIWNNLKSPNLTQWTNNCTPVLGNKTLNQSNFDYSTKSFKKYPLRAKDTLIREISNRVSNHYKMISRFIIAKTQNMIG